MSLKDTIAVDLKKAMLAKDALGRDVLRMLKADLINKEVELGRDLEPADELAALKRAVKSRRESAEQYDKGGRPDAAEQERAEIALLDGYLPKQLSEDETRAIVEALVEELGLSSKKDMGALMKALMERHQNEVDGKTASRIAASLLS